ncbi:MAG: zinc-dependent alcohol dehydrogenase family protein [Oceanidesulfovibrio sp.]
MRAMLLHDYGDVSNFKPGELPKPEPGPGEALVRIAASGVNPVDCKIRTMAPAFASALPAVLGMDMAGTVEAVGPGVTDLATGDEVWGCVGGLSNMQGTLAEYVAADARLMGKKPKTLSMREAAAMPLVTITAWMLLHERAAIQPDEFVLIHGGTGGVGHTALQLAKASGARTATTVSTTEKADIARRLGADETILYPEEAVEDYVKRLTGGQGFDAVIDTVGGKTLDGCMDAARLEGVIASTNTRSSHDLSTMHAKALTLSVVLMLLPMITGVGRERYRAILDAAAPLVDAGKLKPLLDSRAFGLEDVAQAHTLLEQGEIVGKAVVDID